jgi:hypothetical protein
MLKLPDRKPARGQDLIALAQRLARDAERHALLSVSLASQADRLMMAGLRQLGDAAPPVDLRRSRIRRSRSGGDA